MDAVEDERFHVERTKEMQKRERGADGWDPIPWEGEGRRAARDLKKSRDHLATVRAVVKELGR